VDVPLRPEEPVVASIGDGADRELGRLLEAARRFVEDESTPQDVGRRRETGRAVEIPVRESAEKTRGRRMGAAAARSDTEAAIPQASAWRRSAA
jgi:hypothetical protein